MNAQWEHLEVPECASQLSLVPLLVACVMVSHQWCPGGIIQHLSILINTSASLPKLNWLAAIMTGHKIKTGFKGRRGCSTATINRPAPISHLLLYEWTICQCAAHSKLLVFKMKGKLGGRRYRFSHFTFLHPERHCDYGLVTTALSWWAAHAFTE